MHIIPQLETPAGENFINFEENLIKLINAIENSGLNGRYKRQDLPGIVLEQNFGFNGLILCKDLKERRKNLNIIYAFNMRDKNRISILSDLITLKQIGVRDIIISEGVHPLKTVFNSAKPVYDIDVAGLSLILKKDIVGGIFDGLINNEMQGFFNLGVVAGASTEADGLKIKKLIKIGADKFIINFAAGSPDQNILNFIKSEKKDILLYINEQDIKGSLDNFIKSVNKLNLDGVIIKISNEKDNVFMQYIDKHQ